jgi:DNA-binding CsgD family transcriptional regulator
MEKELLTYRETEILGSVSQGLRNGEIASQLGISEDTVKNHITAIMNKTGLRSRLQLALLFIRSQPDQVALSLAYQSGYRDGLAKRDLQWNHILKESLGQGDKTAPSVVEIIEVTKEVIMVK